MSQLSRTFHPIVCTAICLQKALSLYNPITYNLAKSTSKPHPGETWCPGHFLTRLMSVGNMWGLCVCVCVCACGVCVCVCVCVFGVHVVWPSFCHNAWFLTETPETSTHSLWPYSLPSNISHGKKSHYGKQAS